MKNSMKKSSTFAKLAACLLAASTLAGCGAAERLSRIGEAPSLTPVTNPTQRRDYRPVSMPMPTPQILEPAANSLWRPGARAFFKDQRAKQVGDVMTVVVNIQNERAQLSASTQRSRESGENAAVSNFFGIDQIEADPHVGANADSTFSGTGSVDRSENISIRLAAIVLQILPNGNLAVSGRQEVRVNGDLRELQVAGVIRPEDIRADNTITWDKIAEARISYGGRGTITDVQQPRYGQQIFDVIFPF